MPPSLDALLRALRADDADATRALLAQGLDPAAPIEAGLTPLHLAAGVDARRAARVLLAAGADPSRIGASGLAPLHVAAAAGAYEVLRTLILVGADAEVPAAGVTARDLAHHRGHGPCARLLAVAPLWRGLGELRARIGDLLKLTGDAARTRDERAAAEAAEADVPPAPLPPSGDAAGVKPPEHLMRQLAWAFGPVPEDELREVLHAHARWLATGGDAWPGVWTSLEQAGVVFAVWDGPSGAEGAQAELGLRLLDDVDLRDADLRAANLVGVVAAGIAFDGADLGRAALTDSALPGATFRGARLARADFSRSDLREAVFDGADCTFADFEGCDLTGASFRGADLRGARFAGARLDGLLVG